MSTDDEDGDGRPKAHRGPLTAAELAEKYGWDAGDVEVTDADGKVVRRTGERATAKKSADVEPETASPPDDPHA